MPRKAAFRNTSSKQRTTRRRTTAKRTKSVRPTISSRRPPRLVAEDRAAVVARGVSPGKGKRGERGYLAYLLRQAQAASRLTLERMLAEFGITTPQFVVLTMLRAYPGLSGADLARVAVLTPQTVGVIILNLERDGAIRKTPHPVHGRVLQWTLTRRGTALLDKCRRSARSLERRLTAGLSGRAELTIRRWLSKIATDLQQE